jgi:hypothetical protein
MLDVTTVQARLLEACPDLARRVEVGMDVEQAKKRAINAATALVMDLAEQASEPATSTGLHLQRMRSRFGVLLALPDQRRLGAGGSLRAVRGQVRAALLGWVPFEGASETAFVSGQMSDAQAGVVWWLDVFETIYHERA